MAVLRDLGGCCAALGVAAPSLCGGWVACRESMRQRSAPSVAVRWWERVVGADALIGRGDGWAFLVRGTSLCRGRVVVTPV